MESNADPMEPLEEAKARYSQAQREAALAAKEYFLQAPKDLEAARRQYEEKMAAYLDAEARLRELDPSLIEKW